MDASDREEFEALTDVLKEELNAQFGVQRAHGTDEELRTFAVLLADAVWDCFTVTKRVPSS